MRRTLVAFLACGALLASGTVLAGGARPDKEWKNWFGHFDVGWSLPQGDYGDAVDDDWYVSGGATFWPDTWPVGINLDLAWSQYDISSDLLRMINEEVTGGGQITGGDSEIWSLSGNVMWGPDTGGLVSFYLIGGIGVDWVENRLTDTGLVYYPPGCGYYWCWGGSTGTGTIVKASDTSTVFSYSAGVGLTFELSGGGQIFVEAKYHRAETNPVETEIVPIVVGWRW